MVILSYQAIEMTNKKHRRTLIVLFIKTVLTDGVCSWFNIVSVLEVLGILSNSFKVLSELVFLLNISTSEISSYSIDPSIKSLTGASIPISSYDSFCYNK